VTLPTIRGQYRAITATRRILTGAFDGVIDSARAAADPADPQMLDPACDSGDHLHPNDAGYR
jgi:hypothetical protein